MNGFMFYQRMVHYNPGENGTCYDGPLANGKGLEAALDPLKMHFTLGFLVHIFHS